MVSVIKTRMANWRMPLRWCIWLLLVVLRPNHEAAGSCVGRDYGFGSIVCVDTIEHCGLPGVLPAMASNQLLMVTSDKAGLRWQETYYQWKTFREESVETRAESVKLGSHTASVQALPATLKADKGSSRTKSASESADVMPSVPKSARESAYAIPTVPASARESPNVIQSVPASASESADVIPSVPKSARESADVIPSVPKSARESADVMPSGAKSAAERGDTVLSHDNLASMSSKSRISITELEKSKNLSASARVESANENADLETRLSDSTKLNDDPKLYQPDLPLKEALVVSSQSEAEKLSVDSVPYSIESAKIITYAGTSQKDLVSAAAELTRGSSDSGPSLADTPASTAESTRVVAEPAPEVTLTLDRSERYQTIAGFGGAFTDAAALNILTLPRPLQDCIVSSYFSPEGLQYSMGRVPIGGADFSVRAYTYDDLDEGQTDEDLKHFTLQREDIQMKIPLIQAASRVRGSSGPLKLVASAWSAPVWMKTGPSLDGKGKLQRQYWAVWAQYILKFLKEYRKRGVEFWAVTAQNEPTDGLITDFPINAMGWTALEQAEWVGHFLGPTLEAEGFNDTKIFVLDDNRIALPHWMDVMAADNLTARFVSGAAVHWYVDFLVPASVLDETNSRYPHWPILYTEACTGQWPWQPLKVVLGSWQRAQYYIDDVIDTLNHWAVGWIDWNLALDTKGGPNWAKNFVDAPVIVNAGVQEVYKQPLYYAMGHVTKFVQEGSVRIGLQYTAGTSEATRATELPNTLRATAFLRPDNCTTIVLVNKKRSPVLLEIRDGERSSGVLELTASSFNSFFWC
ncbi:lysosomal acid glucosylceramidase isoform X2 [Hyalella azteca]|uniref:Glucosylceramidase n=1 Tax=Hyalella azteca TaxID=294128 RepID=A0A8B7NBP2_HYAAZ|nr:lysosomal acid glucosylceramidase isoform X2 [Hyalella azteca]